MSDIKKIEEKKQLANDSCNWWKSQYEDVMSDCNRIESDIEQWGWTPDLKGELDQCEKKIDYLINKGKFEVKNLEQVNSQEKTYWHDHVETPPKDSKIKWQYTVYKDGKKVRELKSNNFIHEDNDKVKKMTDEARDNLAKQICDKRDKNKRTYKKKPVF